jgi:hypothetical protein
MDGACTALRDTASKFCSGQADRIAQRPKKRCIKLKIDLMLRPVDCKRDHRQGSRIAGILRILA